MNTNVKFRVTRDSPKLSRQRSRTNYLAYRINTISASVIRLIKHRFSF